MAILTIFTAGYGTVTVGNSKNLRIRGWMKRKMKRRIPVFLIIPVLLALVLASCPYASANGVAHIYGSRYDRDYSPTEYQHNFTTTDNLFGHGVFGSKYSDPSTTCPVGCGGRIYVVEHQEIWTNGTPLTDVSSDGYETVAWDNYFFNLTWPTPLTPGTYDLILDLNVSGPGNYYVWTDIADFTGGAGNITDPIWRINVTGIEVNKTASISGSCPGSDPLNASIGDTVTYCFNVTNTGVVPLTNVALDDDHYGPISLGKDTLAPGESTNGTATHNVSESGILSD
jgi:hypothetical protein